MKEKTDPKKNPPKGCIIVVAIILIALPIWLVSKCVGGEPQKTDYSNEWAAMTYEQKQQFLENKIIKYDFSNASKLENQLKNKIKEMVLDASSINYTLDPSVYNGTARVTEADSAWIFINVKFSSKNAYGVNMPYVGDVTYKYHPEINALSVYKWNIEENF